MADVEEAAGAASVGVDDADRRGDEFDARREARARVLKLEAEAAAAHASADEGRLRVRRERSHMTWALAKWGGGVIAVALLLMSVLMPVIEARVELAELDGKQALTESRLNQLRTAVQIEELERLSRELKLREQELLARNEQLKHAARAQEERLAGRPP